MKRSGFVIDCKITIDKLRLGVEKLNNILTFFPLDVPEEVLIGLEAMSDAFDCSH